MSLTDFLHGVETVVVDSGPRPIQTVRSSVIGLIGTAPGADLVAFPYDKPVLVNRRQAAALIGSTGTLPQAIDAIYDQGGADVPARTFQQANRTTDDRPPERSAEARAGRRCWCRCPIWNHRYRTRRRRDTRACDHHRILQPVELTTPSTIKKVNYTNDRPGNQNE